MASRPYSTTTNPYALTGTSVTETSTDMIALAARVHRQSMAQETLAELWYYRDSAWSLCPCQPSLEQGTPITITQTPNQPATCDLHLYDPFGDFTTENLESSYNYNGASAYDPLFDIHRKFLLRLGVKCYTNLASGITPTASTAVSSGALANLTDGTFGDWTGTPSSAAIWTTVGAATINITVDLGSAQWLRHVAARFGSRSSVYSLPTSVQVSISNDGSNYTAVSGARPLSGDWDNDYTGRAIEAIVCNIEATARYVRLSVVTSSAITFGLDEIAVYGGNAFNWYGRNFFTGYYGDDAKTTPQGHMTVRLTDTLKKLADNYEPYLTPYFLIDPANPNQTDLATIATSLLTATGNWGRRASSGYDSPPTTGEIGWYGTLTGLIFPRWQGNSNSMLGHIQSLWQGVGYNLYADGNGYFQASPLLTDTLLPDRVFIADNDGNQDCGTFERDKSGRDLRNRIRVATGAVQSGGGGITLNCSASQARFGLQQWVVTEDVLAGQPALMEEMAARLLRDFAWRDQTATAEIFPDFDTQLKQVYGFRASAYRLKLNPKANTTVGQRCLGELWQINSMTHTIAYGRWAASVSLAPYYASAQLPPYLSSLTTASGQITANFTAISNSKVSSIEMWTSTAADDPDFPYTLATTISNSGSPTTITATGLTNGVRYFVYLKTVDYRGVESEASNTLSAVCNGATTDNSGWTVTDFANTSETDSYDSASGLYTYRFVFSWTSPPGSPVADPSLGGTKRFQIWGNPFAQPTDPTQAVNWQFTNDGAEWHGDYVPPGMDWTRTTPGLLTWALTIRTAYNFGSGNLTSSVTSITRSSTTATVTMTNHGFQVGDTVTIAGATQSAYNGAKTVTGVIDANTWTFNVAGSPATPATGTITANYHQRIYFKMWTSNMTTAWDYFFPSNVCYYTF